MARRVITLVEMIDDLDGTKSDDVEEVRFSIDGTAYAIDLAPGNASTLREAMLPYVKAARRTGGKAADAAHKSAAKATAGDGVPRSESQRQALDLIQRNADEGRNTTVAEVSEALGNTAAAASQVVKGMVDRGLVTRVARGVVTVR